MSIEEGGGELEESEGDARGRSEVGGRAKAEDVGFEFYGESRRSSRKVERIHDDFLR